MITVSFFVTDGSVVKVHAAGHSGYAEAGSDIVCAAVSALVQTAYLAIKDLGCDVVYDRDDDGMFTFCIAADAQPRHDIDVILRALRVGLEDLRSGFPQYIRTETVNGR